MSALAALFQGEKGLTSSEPLYGPTSPLPIYLPFWLSSTLSYLYLI